MTQIFYSNFDEVESKIIIDELFSAGIMNKREKLVLSARYGFLDGYTGLYIDRKLIARKLNVSYNWVCCLEWRAISKCQRYLKYRKDYLNKKSLTKTL